jgi:hypothetical protein
MVMAALEHAWFPTLRQKKAKGWGTELWGTAMMEPL